MTAGQVLSYVSEAVKEGSEILKKMEGCLSKKNRIDPYPITDIHLSEDKEKIDFNFHWVKLFLKFKLNGKYSTQVGGGENLLFECPLIWGIYDKSTGVKIEKPIVEDSKIQMAPGEIGYDLVYNGSHQPLEKPDYCLLIINQIIYKCLSEFLVKIENIKWT